MSLAPPALSIRGLRKRFGDVVAVDGIDLTVAAGECFGLLGPNGAGKTTTIEICEGLISPDEGEVRVLDLDHAQHTREIRARIGISLQETQLAEKLTVDETLQLFHSFYPRRRPVESVTWARVKKRAAPSAPKATIGSTPPSVDCSGNRTSLQE